MSVYSSNAFERSEPVAKALGPIDPKVGLTLIGFVNKENHRQCEERLREHFLDD